ncbi:hypothetical protein TNIN_322541 [Trichonephila inaurata madagascariensis]|uniref:Uncharacterized protein n=1 Tax=Trichonephila inaurata madagascariensis TaxID=2747483 RepID=A0A8X6Y7B2_9ARAC|nr:hypothetical protein TNIN_322541 [Trichonephila inaurata madagascariensis]
MGLDPDIEDTAQYLWTIAKRLTTECPAASRHYMFNLKRNLIMEPNLLYGRIKPYQYCKYCGSVWTPGNHKVKIQPIPPPNCHIKKLLKCEEQNRWRLNLQQKRKLKQFRQSTNKIIYTCNICKKTSKFKGLKKCSNQMKNITHSIRISTVKRKKGDINAGLFIKTPVENKLTENFAKNKQEILEGSSNSDISKQFIKSEVKSSTKNKQELSENSFGFLESSQSSKKANSKQNIIPEVKSSTKKKNRKSLLEKILNEEQEAKKQKSLSSFLISL